PSGGQRGAVTRNAPTVIRAPTATAATTSRTGRYGNRSQAARVSKARLAAPTAPPAQPIEAPGIAAATLATWTSHHAGGQAPHPTSSASQGAIGWTAVAITPSTVTSGTAGAARRLAATPMRLTCSASMATTGPHITCAAAGTATASARGRGTPRADKRSRHDGASTSSPKVASTDSANPYDRASSGARQTSTRTAVNSAGK